MEKNQEQLEIVNKVSNLIIKIKMTFAAFQPEKSILFGTFVHHTIRM